MRLIDADALLKKITEDFRGDEGWFGDTWDFLNTIKNAPTIDAVPVVRCLDCKYWEPATLSSGNCGREFDVPAYKDDYCSYGERESDDK